jgi:hypothetical protein
MVIKSYLSLVNKKVSSFLPTIQVGYNWVNKCGNRKPARSWDKNNTSQDNMFQAQQSISH